MTDNPYNLKTQAGQELWTFLNNNHGSSMWGKAGELILEIERAASAKAWDEGYDTFEIDNGLNGAYEYVTENPYREAEE